MNTSFNKYESLKSKKLIKTLFSEGQSVSNFPLKLIYIKSSSDLKVGVSVSKKNFKKAVNRNYIKRLMREAYRLNKNMLIDNNITNYAIMFLYIGKKLPVFSDINVKLKQTISLLIKDHNQ